MASLIPQPPQPTQPMNSGLHPYQKTNPGTAPPWLTGGTSPAPTSPTGPANGLASLGTAQAQSSGTPWDFGPVSKAKGSKTFDFEWDPENPLFGGDAQGFMAHSTFGAGATPGSSLKMSLRGADGKELFNSGDTGSLSNLTSGKLAKGRYSLAVDPSDPNAEWHMNLNKRGSSYYDNGGVVSTAAAPTGWSGGTDTSGWDKNASAAQWDAGAAARFAEQNAVNPGFGAALNPGAAGGFTRTGAEPPVVPGGATPGLPPPPTPTANPAARINDAVQPPPGGNGGGFMGPAAGGLAGLGAASGGGAPATGGTSPGPSMPAIDWSKLGPQFTGLNEIDTDFTGAASKGADAAYKGATQFMDGDFAKEREQAHAQLVAQGLQPGSEAYESQMERIERGQNAARTNAAFTAQGVGHSQAGELLSRALAARAAKFGEQSTGFGLGLQGRGQDITRDTAGVNASLALRRLGLDENSQEFQQLMALIASSRGGVNMPNFGGVSPLDVAGANSIASGNANAAAGREGMDRAAWAQIAAQIAGGFLK